MLLKLIKIKVCLSRERMEIKNGFYVNVSWGGGGWLAINIPQEEVKTNYAKTNYWTLMNLSKLLQVTRRKFLFNPLIPVSDQDRISPYYIYTISCRHVMRIKKNVNNRIANWSDTKFSKLTKWESFGRQ